MLRSGKTLCSEHSAAGVLWQGKLEGLLKTFVEGIEWHVRNLKQMLADETQATGKTD